MIGIAASLLLSSCDKIANTTESTAGAAAGEQRAFEIGAASALTFRWAPAGTFSRYSGTGQAEVRLDQGYWIAEGVITQEVWQKVMGVASTAPERPGTIPAARVSMQDCAAFIKRLKSPAKGWKFDLPTEDQWEYACRAGANTVNARRPAKLVWIHVDRTGTLQPAGIGPNNAWSIRDANGNLSEWCADVLCEANARGLITRQTQTGIPGLQRGSSFLSVNKTGFRIVLVRDEAIPSKPEAGPRDTRLSGL